jgi:hypothetical protein
MRAGARTRTRINLILDARQLRRLRRILKAPVIPRPSAEPSKNAWPSKKACRPGAKKKSPEASLSTRPSAGRLSAQPHAADEMTGPQPDLDS